MQIEVEQRTESAARIVLEGRFDAFEAEGFADTVTTLLADGGAMLTVDLEAVNFIDSSGLAELVRAMKRARSAGGDVVLSNPSAPVQIILELTRLDAAFDVVTEV